MGITLLNHSLSLRPSTRNYDKVEGRKYSGKLGMYVREKGKAKKLRTAEVLKNEINEILTI